MSGFVVSLTVITLGCGLFTAVVANRLAGARGWSSESSLSVVALTAALFAIADLTAVLPLPPDAVLAGQRLAGAAMALHVLAWLRYSAATVGPRRGNRWLELACLAVSVLASIPGVGRTGALVHRAGWGGIAYADAPLGPVGHALVAVLTVGALTVAGRFAGAARRGARDAWVIVAGFAACLACALHDLGVYAGLVPTPRLASFGVILPIGAVTWALAGRFLREAAELACIREELERHAEEQRRQLEGAEDALRREARLAALGRFAGAVAHAMNNPAAVALANLGLLSEAAQAGALQPEEAQESLQDTREALGRIAGVTRQLLFASRFAADSWDEPVALAAIVAEARTLAAQRHRLPEVGLLDVPAELRTRGHADGFAAVVANLLVNAHDAGAGRRVTVAIRARATADGLELTVTDDGPGMAPATLARTLEPFFTTKPPPSGECSLAISRALLRSQGGDLAIESAPGVGTRVTLRLPAAGADAVGGRTAPEAAANGVQGDPGALQEGGSPEAAA